MAARDRGIEDVHTDAGHPTGNPSRPGLLCNPTVLGLSPWNFPLDPVPGVFLMMPRCHQSSQEGGTWISMGGLGHSSRSRSNLRWSW